MQDNTDNPAFPIIEFLNEQINKEEENRKHWQEIPSFAAQRLHTLAVNRLVAFKEVLDYVEETFKPE